MTAISLWSSCIPSLLLSFLLASVSLPTFHTSEILSLIQTCQYTLKDYCATQSRRSILAASDCEQENQFRARGGAFLYSMLSTVAMIGICVALSFSFLLTGSVLAVWFLRLRDRRRARLTSSLRKHPSTYHRAHLSIDGANYSHIQQPRTSLRRSGYLPYGVVAGGCTEAPSLESIRSQQMASNEKQTQIDEMVPAPRRAKSLRQKFYGHSLNAPKTRCQKNIDKAIAQNSMPFSPLSAITEFSEPFENQNSDLVELPTSIIRERTAEKIGTGQPWGRPVSIQWPLPLTLHRSKDTPVTVVASISARDSIPLRKDSMDATVHSETRNISRSASMASAISNAPGGHLPLLPPRTVYRYSQKHEDTTRRSNASLDTIGSSVLDLVSNSPSQTIMYNPTTSTIDLSSPGLQQFSPARARGDVLGLTVSSAVGRRAQQGTVNAFGTHSFRASLDEHTTMRNVSNSKIVDRSDQRFNGSRLSDDWLRTIDASNWKQDLPSRPVLHRSTLSPSLPAPIARRTYQPISTYARHSMFDSHISVRKRAPNQTEHTSAAQILTRSPRRPAAPRPASIASGNPYQWDLRPTLSFAASPVLSKKGHKRQDCVRISNFPTTHLKRNSKLPEMMEGEIEEPWTLRSKPRVPGLTLLEVENGTPALRARASLVDIKASSSPFHNRPVLEPTTKNRPSCRIQNSTETHGTLHPDSDIFTNPVNNPVMPTMFDERHSGPRNKWPLSSTSRNNIKLNSTSLPLSAIEKPYECVSPMLPSPALTSATLFPRKSGVAQGPRDAPTPTRSSRNAPPSPPNGWVRQKIRGDEHHRSVMMLRHETSEGKTRDQTNRFCRNMREHNVSNFSLPNASQDNIRLGSKSTKTTSGNLNMIDRRRGSNMGLSLVGIGTSRSNMSMPVSPSILSIGGVSVWDDASVCDDLDLEMRNSMIHVQEQTTLGGHDPEAYENFLGQEQRYIAPTPSSGQDQEEESRLTGPQGKSLGISNWDTPGSLYDKEGFLKEQ